MDALGSALKEKDECLDQELQRERQKRIRIIQEGSTRAAIDERQEDKERSMLKDLIKRLEKEVEPPHHVTDEMRQMTGPWARAW